MHHQRHTYYSLGNFKDDLQKINGHKYFIRRVRTQKIKRKLIFHGRMRHWASKVHNLNSMKNMDPERAEIQRKSHKNTLGRLFKFKCPLLSWLFDLGKVIAFRRYRSPTRIMACSLWSSLALPAYDLKNVLNFLSLYCTPLWINEHKRMAIFLPTKLTTRNNFSNVIIKYSFDCLQFSRLLQKGKKNLAFIELL